MQALYSEDSIAAQYLQCTDDELVALEKQSNELMPSAAVALRNELARRNLEISADVGEDSALPQQVRSRQWMQDIAAFWKPVKVAAFPAAHFLVTVLALPLATSLCYMMMRPVLGLFLSTHSLQRGLPLVLPFFPLQVTVAFVGGICAAAVPSEFWRHRSAEWVWILPAIWLLWWFVLYHPPLGGETRWERFFWSEWIATRQIQFFVTMPLLAAIAYAIGHFFGRRALAVPSQTSTATHAVSD